MYSGKKGIESHILAILIISAIMTFFLTTVINFIYEPDPIQCQNFDFEIKNQCKESSHYEIIIKNSGNFSLSPQINGKTEIDYNIPINNEKKINVKTSKDYIEIMPTVKLHSGIIECKGKIKKLNTNTFTKC